jgi:uncharacterized protein YgiM (DUF1202 family)
MRDTVWMLRNGFWALVAVIAAWFVVTLPAPDNASATTMTVAEAQMVDRLRELAHPPATIPRQPEPDLQPIVVAAADKPAQPAAERLVVVPEALNLRSAPSMDSEVLDRLLQGQPVTVAEREGGWIRVATADGQDGWAAADFLAAAN